MARNDIRPYSGPQCKKSAPKVASGAFRQGEPVIVTSNDVTEAGDDPAAIFGIAAMDADPTAQNAMTRFTQPTGAPITVYDIDDAELFQCNNFATDGAGTAATPTQANAVGVEAGLTLASGTWSVDTGTANLLVFIEKVLDARGNSIADPFVNAGTGATVVFRFL
jgi:hypothetical protein